MKKLIIWLALLLPFIANAQVNGTIQKTASSGVVRGNFGSSGADTIVTVRGVSVNGQLLQYNSTYKKWIPYTPSAIGSTGIISGGTMTGVGSANLIVSSGTGTVLDNTTPASPSFYNVSWVTDTIGLTDNSTNYIYVTSGGVIMATTVTPTPQDYRTRIYLGRAQKISGSITSINGDYVPVQQSPANIDDMFKAYGLAKNGLVITPDSINLKIDVSSGEIFGFGINFSNSVLSPNNISYSAVSKQTFRMVTSGDISVTNVTDLPVGFYNPSGTTVSAISGGANESSIFTVYKFPTTGNVRVLYGNTTYASLSAAVTAIGTYIPTPPAVFRDAIIIGYIAAVKNATNLSNTAQAVFVTTNKFGLAGMALASSALTNYVLKSGDTMTGTLNGTDIVLSVDSYINDLRIGKGAGNDTTNTVFGRIALRDNTTGKYGTFLGYRSGMRNTTGEYNTFLGYFTGQANTTGTLNTFIGAQAGFRNTSGSYNLGIGVEALNNNTTGANNTAVGGYDAMLANTTGSANTALGYASLISNIDGNENVALGNDALFANTGGDGNVAVGRNALENVTTGNGNIGIGYFAGDGLITGSNNTIVGSSAGLNVTGSNNLLLGQSAVPKSLSGSNQLSIGNTIYGDLSQGDVEIKRYLSLPNIPTGTASTDSALVIKSDNTIGRVAPLQTALSISTISNGGTANGLSLSSGTLRLHKVTSTTGGVFTTGTDTIAGSKIYTSNQRIQKADPVLVLDNSSGEDAQVSVSSSIFNVIDNATGTKGFKVNLSTGQATNTYLAGTGTRMVVADNVGALSTQAIPGGGGGSVTGVAVATANGLSGTSDGATVVPTLTLSTTVNSPVLAGNGTAISAATTTGSGSTVVLSASPTLVTPNLGTPSALVGTNITGTASGLSIGGTAANATTWNGATRSGSVATGMTHFMSYNGTTYEIAPASVAQTFLGLGSNAYTSTAYAPLNSPTFTGTPSLPTGTIAVTQTQGDNSTKIATTAYVDALGGTILGAQKQIANIYTNTSTTGTTTETLFTSNIAQSNLSADGDRIDFNFAGSFGLNANDKFVYLLIGGNTIAVSGNASSKSFWECEGYLLRTSSTTFRLFIRKAVDYVYSSAIADYTVTDFNPLTFSVLGQTNNASFPVTVQMGYLQGRKAP